MKGDYINMFQRWFQPKIVAVISVKVYKSFAIATLLSIFSAVYHSCTSDHLYPD